MSYNPLYEEYAELAKNPIIVIDSCEKDNHRYRERVAAFESLGLTVERQKLLCGDYSAKLKLPNGDVVDLTNKLAVERKMDMHELLQCFTRERERFVNELKRAKDTRCTLMIVTEEGAYNDLVLNNYEHYITTAQALGTYHSFQQKYNVSFEWVTPETFPIYVYQTMRFALLDYMLKHYPSGECLWEQQPYKIKHNIII